MRSTEIKVPNARSGQEGNASTAFSADNLAEHLRPLGSLLERYHPISAEDADTLDRFQRFVAGNPDCLLRSLLVGHLTGSCWLVDPSMQDVLLMQHAKIGQVFQPGGHADGDGDLLNVALKEAKEESGIDSIVALAPAIFDLDIHGIPERHGVPAHLHYDVRFLLRSAKRELVQNEESLALKWVPIDALHRETSLASLLRMREKWNHWMATSRA